MKTLFTPTKILALLFFFFLTPLSGFTQTCGISGDTIVCSNGVEAYSATVSGGSPPYTYQWNAFGGIASGSGASVTVAWGSSASGQVSLVVRNPAGNIVCTSLLNVQINPRPLPVVTPSLIVGCGDRRDQGAAQGKDDCYAICDSTWVTYSTPAHPGSTYAWSTGGAADVIPSTTNSIQVMWTGTGSGSVTVTETTAEGCTATASACINVAGRPTAQFTSLNTPAAGVIDACLNQPVQFIDQSFAGAGSPLISYQWLFGDGHTAAGAYPGLANQTHAYASPGLYTVSLIVENECHCKDTLQLQVNVSSAPGPQIFCISTVCPGNSVTYHTDASGCGQYNWSVQNGTIQGSATDSAVTVLWGSSGAGIITLSVSGCQDSGYCTTPTSVYVPVIVPDAQITGPSQVCLYECNRYHISCSIPIDSIAWHFPPGVTVITDSTNVHEVQVCFNDPSFSSGNLTVDYFHHTPGSTNGLSCGGQSALAVNVRPRLFLHAPAQICDGDDYSVSATPPVPGSISWSITNQAGNITYLNTTTASGTNLDVNNWPYGAGNFIVTASGDAGQFCNSPQTISLTVNPRPAVADSIFGPEPVCAAQPYTYTAIPTSSDLSMTWSVQHGSPATSAGTSISVLWDATGPYSVSAAQVNPLTGCRSDSITRIIGSMIPLAAIPPAGDTTPCANGTATYSIDAAGDDFVWTISPSTAGSIADGQHSPHVSVQWNNYNGAATISLVRTVCGQTVSSTLNITVGMPPSPVINAPSATCEGAVTAISTTTAASAYTWSFGDGTPSSSLQNPPHVYQAPGNYVVSLSVVYPGCPATTVVTANIVVNPKPDVTISTPDPNVYCGPTGTVNMAVAGPVSGISYNWYNTSSSTPLAANATSYSSNTIGTYYAIGTNLFGCSDISNSIRIDSLCDTCSADPFYTLDFNRYRLGCNTDSFTGTFTAGAVNPRWNFDDPFSGSNTASGTVAMHPFSEPGYYRVTFCADVPNLNGTGYCRKCVMKVDTIEYVPGFYDSLYCASGIDSVRVKLINNTKWLTTLPLPSYSWVINPGGITSTASDPTMSLAAGTYSVSLTVDGVCTLSKNITIPGFPHAAFTSLDSVCAGAGILFSNTAAGAYTNALWQFGDGASLQSADTQVVRVYSSPGTYPVRLTVMNAYGCIDSAEKQVTVVPNTLSVSVSPAAGSLCEGDSLVLTGTPSGGYPGYSYLWSNLQTTPAASAAYTSAYYVDVTDNRLCFARSNISNVLVNPVPRPVIQGKENVCLFSQQPFHINYPAGLYTIDWLLDGASVLANSPVYYFFANVTLLGSHTLVAQVSSPDGCTGSDTFRFTVYPNPVANITSASPMLCEGQINVLTGSPAPGGMAMAYWNTGSVNDTLVTSVPGSFTYTVTDTFGCKASATKVVNPLPDFCGMMTGCYEICDSVQQLIWHAPPGYAAYQWFHNNAPIAGAVSDTLHIPLYQSGSYTVQITAAAGCAAMSDPVDLSFVSCGSCRFAAHYKIDCGPVTDAGDQTYSVNIQVNNSLGNGAGYSITSASGAITGLTPSTLSAGVNNISFTFIDVPPANGTACFNLGIYHNNTKCDTVICIKLPACEMPCDKKVEIKKLDCAGWDKSGNPLYNLCADVYWGGNAGANLTVSTASGSFSPNPVTLVNGVQSLCFTYTDLPPHNTASAFYFSFFDPETGKVCRDSVKREYKPCSDTCNISVHGLCVFCEKESEGIITYKIGVTVFNPFPVASVSVLPAASGTFGSISPNPIPGGMQQFHIMFTDDLPKDTIICFRVLLSSGGKTCWQDVCVFLPECNGQYLGSGELEAIANSISVAPNPARDQFDVYYTIPPQYGNLNIELLDIAGRSVTIVPVDNLTGVYHFEHLTLNAGVYFVNVRSGNQLLGFKRLVMVK